MEKHDYYEVLGVNRDADGRAIKQAYRKLAMQHHPDRNPGDTEAEELFKEAAEAYEVLSNPDKRALYDQFGHDGLSGQQSGFRGMDDIFSHFGEIFSDFFGGDFFNGQRPSRPPRAPRGAEIRVSMTISFEEAFLGAKKEVSLNQRCTCSVCDGSGSAPGTEPRPCASCQGHGQVVQRSGFMTMVTPCPDCSGNGSVIVAKCDKCDGTGREPYHRSVIATVPPGVDSGMRLRLAGEGEKPQTGEPGDLFVFITVEPHPTLQRDRNELHYEAEIPFTRAILGHTFDLELVNETVTVTLPPGTQPGDMVTIEGKGMPVVGREERGDLHVTVKVDLPVGLDDEQRELIEQFEKTI